MTFSIPATYLPAAVAAAILVLLGFAGLLTFLEKRRNRRLHGFAEAGLLPRLIDGYRPKLRWPLNAFVLAGAVMVLVALAGPRWGSHAFTGLRGSREILVLLDTSESMNAVNPPPGRLERAREKVSALLEAYPGDRFGLIAFSGAAALQCPLTKDHAYFKTVLQAVTTDTLSAEGTDIESAFLEAANLFEDGDGGGRGSSRIDRAILLISDGEAVSGDAVAAAGRMAAHGRVVVLGIGDPEGAEVTLPPWMQRSKYAPRNAAPHWSVLDEAQLAAIAPCRERCLRAEYLGGRRPSRHRPGTGLSRGLPRGQRPGIAESEPLSLAAGLRRTLFRCGRGVAGAAALPGPRMPGRSGGGEQSCNCVVGTPEQCGLARIVGLGSERGA